MFLPRKHTEQHGAYKGMDSYLIEKLFLTGLTGFSGYPVNPV
jgi:hypothetical protein